MTVLALAGDTMLGRGVAHAIAEHGPESLIAAEVVAAAREADFFLLNLECCVATTGNEWPAPGKPFFFRAPPRAVEALTVLGVDCVTLANNHALDFGADALLETLDHLAAAGIASVGAGADRERARAPVVVEAGGMHLGVVGVTDHPSDFAATVGGPGVAFADLRAGEMDWLRETIGALKARTDAVIVTPHWGPNMVAEPIAHVRAAAAGLLDAGATLVAGHSAHVFHGVAGSVLFDLGDFVDDYATDSALRNDLGLLWFVELDHDGLRSLWVLPLKLDYCHTRIALGDDAKWIGSRFRRACAALGSEVDDHDGRLGVTWR